MPEVVAKLRHLRISPKKVRPLARVIKGLSIMQAEAQLKYFHSKASEPLIKLVRSAVANAKHNFQLSKSDLYIRNIRVDPGPSLKRFMPRAMGRATPILKRTSHITVTLEIKDTVKRQKIAKEEVKEMREASASEMFKRVEHEHEHPHKEEAYKEPRAKESFKERLARPKLPSIQKRFFRRKAV